MRNLGPYSIAVLLPTLVLSGCRLPGAQGPVSKSLAACRQLSQQGVAAAERGQPQQAEVLLAKAVKASPRDSEARYHYAEALWRLGKRPDAITQLEEAARLAPEDAVLRTRLAEMYLATGQMSHARGNAEHAVDLDPKLSAAWAVRGGVMQAGGQRREALANYLRALSHAPDDRQVLLEVAELYRRWNQPQRALGALHSLADTYSPGEEPRQVLHLTGMAYAALGRYQDAVESLSAAATRQRPTPDILHRLGEVELLAGRPVQAEAAARQALTLEPGHQPSRDLLGRIATAQRRQRPPRR